MLLERSFDPVQPPYNPDVDLDGQIGVEDLMAVLALFSMEFEAYSYAVNEDTTTAIVHVGELDFFDCHKTCDTLEGSWKVVDFLNFGHFDEELQEIAENGLAGFHTSAMLNVPLAEDGNVYFNGEWGANGFGAQGYFEVRNCVCQTEVVPSIEYSICDVYYDQEAFVGCVNEKLANGWYLLGGTARSQNSMYPSWSQGFWRWAE